MRAAWLSLLPLAALCAGPHYTLVKEWGGFGSKPGEFRFPTMLALDRNSNLYVVDQHNHRIQKFDSEGHSLLTWGKEGNGQGQFNYPYGIAIDSHGGVYVSDMNNQRIQKFSADGKFEGLVGGYGSGNAEFKFPYGLAIDSHDILYVIDTLNYRIQKFDRELKFQGAWGTAESIGIKLYMPHEIAVLADGNIALSDRQNHRISEFTPDGKLVRRFGDYAEGPTAAGGRFSEPHGLAPTPDGALLVCDRYNFRVQEFTARGDFELLWRTAGPGDDSRHFPLGIAADSVGNVYVTDHYQHQVQKYRIAQHPIVFPVPQEMESKGTTFSLDEPVRIIVPATPSENDLLLGRELAADLGDRHRLNVSIEKATRLPASGRFILMGAITNPLVKQYCAEHHLTVTPSTPGSEGYVLETTANAAVVAGSDERGAFYGLQSLRQLAAGTIVPGVLIKDWPNQPFRGVKLYLPGRDHIAFFKRFVRDFMALYKYNQLVVEINGAMRLDRHPEVNAGWIDLFKNLSYTRRDRSTGPHGEYQDSPNQDVADGGVLEKAEVADLVQWARHYYIDFIPEVPSLTHTNYLLTRHRELAEVPDAEWPDTYCPSHPGSYKLLFDVMDEVIEAVKPRMVHIGHDEWRAPLGSCTRCGNKDRGELYAQDVIKVHDYLAAKGIRTAMYGDHLLERVRGKGASAQKTRDGYAYRWPGALTPEQVKEKIPKDILLFNWFWRDGKEGNGEVNDVQLADWGFRQVYMNFEPIIQNYARRVGRSSVMGGVPASWAATTEFNFGKDLIYDFLGCANLVWSKHWYEPKDLTAIVQARMPDVRRRLSGVQPPTTDGDPVAAVKFAPGDEATGIAIGEDASSLIFLHASEKPAVNDFSYRHIFNFDDTADLLGFYAILYDDGLIETVPVRYGVNILERTWGTTRNPRTYCYGADPVETGDGTYFAFEWVNPRFGKTIKQVTFKPSQGFRSSQGKMLDANALLLREVRLVKKRPLPAPVKPRP